VRVAIIGAGAAGLASAREFSERGHDVTVFEQGAQAGGIWAYQAEVEDDLLGLTPTHKVYSSLYENLRTNLPSDVMAFKGFPFDSSGGGDDDWPRFPHHSCVKLYLERFIERFNLAPMIRLQQKVESVEPLNEGTTWRVTVAASAAEEFDAVAVCSGHFSEPRVPRLQGITDFQGELRHSHNYRRAADFRGQRVAVLGRGASGADIVQELLAEAAAVYWCGFEAPRDNGTFYTRPFPEKITRNGMLHAGVETEVDSILFCTGYRYELPFLDESIVIAHDNYVAPLYKDILPPAFPRLAIIGLPFLVVPFPLYAMQAKWFAASLDGELTIPTPAKMLASCQHKEAELRAAGVKQRHFHRLGEHQEAYYNDLALECGGEALPNWFAVVVKEAQKVRQANPANFRDVPLSSPRRAHL
jgi:hypothetical protein